MTPEANKARTAQLFEQVMNGHDADLISTFTSHPGVIGSGRGLLGAFADLEVDTVWMVAEADLVVSFLTIRGTQTGPWLWVQDPSGNAVTAGLVLAFRFDDDGQIVDQWLGSDFVSMLQQMGWGIAPVGETVSE